MSDGSLQSLELKRSGGQLPTYAPSFKVDPNQLSEPDRRTLESLLAGIDLASLPERFPAKPIPDAFEYTLTVRRNNTTRTVVFHDMDGHPKALDELAAWIRTHGRS
jgi:hypothetical protein